MKKTLSVFLSALIVITSVTCLFSVISFAEGTEDFHYDLLKPIVGIDGKVPTIDLDNNIIYGIDFGSTDFGDYFEVGRTGLYLHGTYSAAGCIGTGSKVAVTTVENDLSTKIAEFEAVVFGELNGDGVVDVIDAVLTERLSNHIVTEETYNAGTNQCSYDAFLLAADANHDGSVTVEDYSASVDAVVKEETIGQNREDPANDKGAETAIEAQLYNGNELEPDFELTCNGKTLTEGVDYTVSYTENIEVGEAYVTVTATENGAFTGSKTFTFEILPRDPDNIAVKFKNTDNMLYRIGNMNEVALSSLFEATGDVDSAKISVNFEYFSGSVAATYTANTTDWTQGTVKFSGTGVAKVNISHGNALTTDSLLLEVVNAVNTTTSLSATSNNVVLLNDVSFNTVNVYDGYAIYGNGFTMTNLNDVSCSTMHSNCGYVTLNNGILDNVRIVCPVFKEAYYYQSQAQKDSSERYIMSRCAVEALGNSYIYNSYIHGGRACIFTGDGTNSLWIEDSFIYGGTFCNMDLYAGRSVTLKNVTTAMEEQPVTADSTKKMIGLGIVVSSGSLKLTIEGTLKQYNWVSETQANNYLSDYSTLLNKIFVDPFVHSYNSNKYINAGIAYIANWDTLNVADNLPACFVDNRSDKAGYVGKDITISVMGNTIAGGAYSVGSSVALTASEFNIPSFTANKYNIVSPTFTYSHTKNEIAKSSDTEPYCTYANGLISVGTKDATKIIDFTDAVVEKDGATLDYTMTVNSDKATVNGKSITFDTSVTDYTVTFTVTENSAGYNANGTAKLGTTTFTWDIDVHIAMLAYDKPVWNNVSSTGSGNVWLKGGTSSDPDYSDAMPIYGGLSVIYYDKNGVKHTDDLSSETVVPEIDSGNGFATATLSNGCILKISTSHSGYAYQLCDSKIYLYKTTLRNNKDTTSKTITYSLTDPNGQTTESSVSVTYSYNSSSPSTEYGYNTFLEGKFGSDSSCLAKGTMITLADGSQKPIENITYNDKVLTWNFFTGDYEAKDIAILVDHGEDTYCVLTTEYSDGTSLRTIGDHGVFDYDENQYIYLTEGNYRDYIDHRFVKQGENGEYELVTLTNAYVTDEVTNAYSITSVGNSNAFAEGLLTVAPPDDFYNWIEMGDKLRYDTEQFQEDVNTYGLYDYDVFKDYVTYEQYVAFNGAYLKIPVEKGCFTFEYILELIELYSKWMPQET